MPKGIFYWKKFDGKEADAFCQLGLPSCLAPPAQGLTGVPSFWGWHIPNLSELMAPQLLGLQRLWLPSSWQPGWLRFCRDLLPFSQIHFLKIHFGKKLVFFMTKGFSIMPATCKILLSEWGVCDWVKPVLPLCYTRHWGSVCFVSQASWEVCEIVEQEQGCSVSEFWQVYSYSQNMAFTEKRYPFIQHMFDLSAYFLQVSTKEV